MRKFIVIIFIVMLLFNGLANQRELNKLAIISCIGVDINEDGKFVVSVNVLNTKQSNGDSSGNSQKEMSEVTIYEATENSIQEALRNIIKQSPKRLSLAHMKLLMLSEELVSKKDIMDVLDFFIRDYEGGNNFTIVISKGTKPKEFMQSMSEASNDFAMNIRNSIEITNKYRGSCTNDILNDNLRNILKEGGGLVINSIAQLEEEEEDSDGDKKPNVIISDMAYFKNGKLAGYLEKDDNITYNLLRNQLFGSILEIGENEDRIVLEITSASSKLKPRVENGVYSVDISVCTTCNITELGKNIKVNNNEQLEKIEKVAKERITKHILDYIENCKSKYDVDLIEFGNLFYKYRYKDYIDIKGEFYKEIYDNINTNINVDVQVKNHGGVKKSW